MWNFGFEVELGRERWLGLLGDSADCVLEAELVLSLAGMMGGSRCRA